MYQILVRTLRPRFVFWFATAILGSLFFAAVSDAAIYVPGDTVPGTSGTTFGWSRGSANSTYSGWDVFEAVTAPGFSGTPFIDQTPDLPDPFGSASLIGVSAGAVGVGSGNAYSPFVALDFSSIIRSGTAGGGNTRIVAQFRTGGSEIDYGSILLSTSTATDGTIAPSLMLETGRTPLGGFGGNQVDYLALWDLSSSQAEFRIDFNAAASSLSLQQFHVDTFVQNSAFITPSAVPEPGTLATLGVVAGVASIGYRFRRRYQIRSY